MGVVADLTTQEIKTRFPVIFDQLQQFEAGWIHPEDLQLPGREPFRDFAGRIRTEVAYLETQQSPVLVIAHHSALTMLVHVLRSQRDDDIGRSPYAKHSFPHLSITGAMRVRASSVRPVWEVCFVGVKWREALLGGTP
jgi:broad specificity phosphatase PhoE